MHIRHSEEISFRGVGYFGNTGFNISRQRVSKLTSQKAVSLVNMQPWGNLCWLPRALILHRISIKIFACIGLFPKIRKLFTVVLKSVIKRIAEVLQTKFRSFECEITWASDLSCPGCCLLLSECSWGAIFWYDRRSFWAPCPPLLSDRTFEIGRVYIVESIPIQLAKAELWEGEKGEISINEVYFHQLHLEN